MSVLKHCNHFYRHTFFYKLQHERQDGTKDLFGLDRGRVEHNRWIRKTTSGESLHLLNCWAATTKEALTNIRFAQPYLLSQDENSTVQLYGHATDFSPAIFHRSLDSQHCVIWSSQVTQTLLSNGMTDARHYPDQLEGVDLKHP